MYTNLPVINNITITQFHSVFECIFNKYYSFEGEAHDFWECVYVLEEEAGIMAGDKTLILKKDELIFHKPNEFHNIWAVKKPYRCFIMTFDMEGALTSKFENKIFKLKGDIKKQFDSIINEWRLRNDGKVIAGRWIEFFRGWDNYPIENSILALKTAIFFMNLYQSESIALSKKYSKERSIYNTAIQFMVQNLNESLTIEDISGYLNISPSTLKNIFRQYTGHGVHTHFLKMKINRATELLNDGFSVSETSNILNFSNVSYFSVAYKRETGLSPKDIHK